MKEGELTSFTLYDAYTVSHTRTIIYVTKLSHSNNIIVLDLHFNLTKKSNFTGRFHTIIDDL